MKIQNTIATLAAAAVLNAFALPAQVSTQELYTVKFKATCTPSDTANGRSSKMTDRDLIEECVGTGFSKKDLKRNFALVYNPSADSLQVVNRSDGSLVCDSLIFDGGTNAVAGNQLSRFVFVFSPNQPEAIGSAVITERSVGNSGRARITGRIQFTRVAQTGGGTNTTDSAAGASEASTNETSLPTPDGSGSTNSTDSRDLTPNGGNGGDNVQSAVVNGEFVQASAAASAASPGEVEICTGTFTVGKLFRPGTGNNDDNNDNETPDTGNIGGTDGDSSTNNPSTNALNSSDTRFVTQATQGGLLEIELANLALQNSTNDAVRAYAETLIQDHTQANQQLAQIAGAKGATVPTTLDASGQNAVNRLGNLSGRQFDRQFANQAVATHRQAIQLFQNEASRGDDEELRTFAQSTLPTLQEHLADAQQLQTGL